MAPTGFNGGAQGVLNGLEGPFNGIMDLDVILEVSEERMDEPLAGLWLLTGLLELDEQGAPAGDEELSVRPTGLTDVELDAADAQLMKNPLDRLGLNITLQHGGPSLCLRPPDQAYA